MLQKVILICSVHADINLSAGMLPVVTAEVPLDELNRAPVQGQHFGFPYLHGACLPDPGYGEHAQANEYTKPALDRRTRGTAGHGVV